MRERGVIIADQHRERRGLPGGGGGVCMQFACAVGMFVRAGGTQGSRNCQKLLEDSTNAWALPVYKLYNVCGYMEEARGASHRHEMYRA